MKHKNADTILMHPSSGGTIMTAKDKPIELSATTNKELLKIYRQERWQRRAEIDNKYIRKGTAVEEDGVTLYSLHKSIMLKKNEERLANDYFNGEIDVFIGEEIRKAKKTIDIKCSWSWETFPSFLEKVNAAYDYQGQAYMDLCGAESHTIAYCLVNTPAKLIEKEINNLFYELGVGSEDPQFIKRAIQKERDSIYDLKKFIAEYPDYKFYSDVSEWVYDIPITERVYEVTVNRDEKKIEELKKRWDDCRKWMNNNLFIS
jgi:hypothetical protein